MLIIFDCDGVLVDSESLAAEIFSEVLAKFDISFAPDQCFQKFHGKTLSACYQWIEQNFKTQLPANFDGLLRAETSRQFALKLQPVVGIQLVLKSLSQNNIPFCVASNGDHEKIAHSLSVTELDVFFKHRFSSEDVLKGKPDPDLFLFAANQMGFSPQDCIVIEDSDSGVRAAQAANMEVFKYVPSTTASHTFSEPSGDEREWKNEESTLGKVITFSSMEILSRILGLS